MNDPASDQFDQSLQIVLQKLGKPDWQIPLQDLVARFAEVPAYDEIDIRSELLNLLWDLAEAASVDVDLPLESIAAIRLAKLECWTLRAFKADDKGVAGIRQKAWNPFEESFRIFRDGSSAVQVAQASAAYPAEDIIKRWARDRLR